MRNVGKRAIAFCILLISALLRGSIALPAFFGGRGLLLIPAVVALSLFEETIPALLYGFAAGVLWDLTAAAPDGLFTLYLGAIALCVSLLARYAIRRKVSAALAASAVFLLLHAAVSAFAGASGFGDGNVAFFTCGLPAVLAAEVCAVGYYYIYKAVYADRKRGVVMLPDRSR
ncbi:MAG: hypothetical protein IJ766_00780 [Clostridia bacterium]|nr:hypothetical protein [Clostridia bacterium]